MSDLALNVNGFAYGGWKRIRVTRGIESVCGSFDLEVSDRWAGSSTQRPIYEEDECSVKVGETALIVGHVEQITTSYDAAGHSLTIAGRDKAGLLVDCSAVLDKWEFRKVSVLTLAQKVAAPFGVTVTLQPGLQPPVLSEKLTIDPGDTAFEAIERACRMAALLPVSDGNGGIVLSRAGNTRCPTALVEGENILSASGTFDASNRFRTYKVLGQHHGKDSFSGAATAHVQATATDLNVRRSERVLLVRPERDVDVAKAKARAQWEATVRAARGDVVTVVVQGWKMSTGALWPVNSLVRISSPRVRVNGEMLITEATYSLDDQSGSTTRLTLKSPTAFLPEPVLVKPSKGSELWKEIAHGV